MAANFSIVLNCCNFSGNVAELQRKRTRAIAVVFPGSFLLFSSAFEAITSELFFCYIADKFCTEITYYSLRELGEGYLPANNVTNVPYLTFVSWGDSSACQF
jgi:hypothetical protein